MSLTDNSHAILLLTAHFTESKNASVKPLTTTEWGRFAAWLKEQQLSPCSLNTENLDELFIGWKDKTITTDRLGALIRRGNTLALAVEKWQRAGLWVMTRSDSDYPKLLKQRLKSNSPPVLFGCGNRDSLNSGGLAVVGSRKANLQDLEFSRAIGAKAASKGVQVISGGARGVDESAMIEALNSGGNVIGVVAESLMKVTRSLKYRQYLTDGRLVLVSPFNPEAGFSVAQAMDRNKLIYCLSDVGFVVQSETKGGTWSGANENLRKRWVPLWVRRTSEKGSGNDKITKAGARWAPNDVDDIDINDLIKAKWKTETLKTGLFNEPVSVGEEDRVDYEANQSQVNANMPKQTHYNPGFGLNKDSNQMTESPDATKNTDEFYELFLSKVQFHCKDDAKSSKELADLLSLQSTQLKTWLKRATNEGKLTKKSRPVRYHWLDQGGLPLNPAS